MTIVSSPPELSPEKRFKQKILGPQLDFYQKGSFHHNGPFAYDLIVLQFISVYLILQTFPACRVRWHICGDIRQRRPAASSFVLTLTCSKCSQRISLQHLPVVVIYYLNSIFIRSTCVQYIIHHAGILSCYSLYCPLANRTSFSAGTRWGRGVLKWTSLNRSPVLATRCH